jgi:predicted nucleotidyltransferase
MDIAALIEEKKKEIREIAAKHGARNVRVFGSIARGEARPDTDVDFLVDLEPGRTLLDLGGLLMELRDLLGLDVDVVTEHHPRSRPERGGVVVRDPKERLRDILDAIANIERYAARGRQAFDPMHPKPHAPHTI